MSKISTITLADGSKRYRFTADVGKYPDGRRRQQRFTFDRKKDAEAALGKMTHQRREGTLTPRWNGTVDELCDEYLRSATFGKEANTEQSYTHALKAARARLGKLRASAVTRQDIEDLRDWMLTSGRKRGGTPGTGVGARSVRLTIGRLSAAYEQAIDDGKLARNPCRRVKLPKLGRRDERWSDAELGAFLATSDADRLAAAWRLSVYGLRRGEVCGLRWQDIDLEAGTLTVAITRPVVNGHPIVKTPKSERGGRTLPLDGQLVTMLQALHDRQVTEEMEAGEAYEPSGYVVVDELGRAVNPEWYSDEFHRVRDRAGVRRIRLHDERRTINSLMAAAGVPEHIRAAWCGHTAAVNVATYTAARPEELAAASTAVARITKAT
jgi:integrase